jgi:hypothetical protein
MCAKVAIYYTEDAGNPAAVAIAFQHLLPQSSEIFLVLSFEGVTGCIEAVREDLFIPAATK